MGPLKTVLADGFAVSAQMTPAITARAPTASSTTTYGFQRWTAEACGASLMRMTIDPAVCLGIAPNRPEFPHLRPLSSALPAEPGRGPRGFVGYPSSGSPRISTRHKAPGANRGLCGIPLNEALQRIDAAAATVTSEMPLVCVVDHSLAVDAVGTWGTNVSMANVSAVGFMVYAK
jgi:hypothetical protein